jgi:hypothetical protein
MPSISGIELDAAVLKEADPHLAAHIRLRPARMTDDTRAVVWNAYYGHFWQSALDYGSAAQPALPGAVHNQRPNAPVDECRTDKEILESLSVRPDARNAETRYKPVENCNPGYVSLPVQILPMLCMKASARERIPKVDDQFLKSHRRNREPSHNERADRPTRRNPHP